MKLMNLAGAVVLAAVSTNVAMAKAPQTKAAANIQITGVTLPLDQAVRNANGVLTIPNGTVTGLLGGLPFTTNITNFQLQLLPPGGTTCSVLNLELGPISVDLLGLYIDTSPICLDITAIRGGGLLGNLLCGLAGTPLDQITSLVPLQNGLVGLLNDVLNQQNKGKKGSPPGQMKDSDLCSGECEILFLSLGPLDLTLLGLNVMLDDCEGGPVQICVSASEGDGILGDLLCGLTGNPLGRIKTLQDIVDFIDRIL